MKLKTIFTATVATLALTSTSALAQDWQKKLSSSKKGSFPNLKPIQLTYHAKFNNALKAGTISFVFDKKDKRYPNFYISQAFGSSNIKLLPYTFNMTSFASAKTLKPKLCILNEKDKKETDDITNTISSSKVVHKKTTVKFKDNSKKVKERTFTSPNTHDFLSTMLYLRSQKLENGSIYNLCVHPFASPYFASIKVLGREKHLGKNTIKLDVALRKINTKTLQLESYKKVQSATIWITDDELRIPLEFKLGVKVSKLGFNIGSVNLTLVAQQKP